MALLFRLFWIFILRRVLGRGLLASRTARISVLLLLVTAFAGFTLLSYVVIRQYFGGTGLLEPVLQAANVSVAFWALVTYVLIRVLFMKADELLKLSFSLPVTNKERTLAFGLFELSVVFVMMLFIFGAFSVSTVLVGGPPFIPKVLASIWFPAQTAYLLLSLGYYLLERALLTLRVSRLRSLIVPMVLGLGLVAIFPYTNEQSAQIAQSHVEGRDYWSPALSFALLQEKAGIWICSLVFLVTSAAIVGAIMAAAPKSYVPIRRFFILLPSWLAKHRFGVYILVMFRNFETTVAVLFVIIFSIFMWVYHLAFPPYVLALVTFQGIYAYSNSETLRRMVPFPGRTFANYLRLVGSQTVLLGVVAIPVLSLSLAQGISWDAIPHVAVFCLSNILISTLIGIAFPPEKGNPFTVLIGVVVTLTIVMIIALGLNIFNFHPAITAIIFILLNLLIVGYSIFGMQRLERIARHEVVS
ncbi:hypothetical protein KKI43_14125 [Arthrobacter sp. GN70]|uniref:Uncharacterized protein n=1 Tax=Arthrobacter terricola TaxID=2547396 RepID=A0A4R5KL15_9MICC|nr:hypothetical protein [Arthrobacter sp. GN70]TDF95237.1 hypothetical protein E1809_12015 [Arthrobacter terricola]